jgi:LysM repeat protein
VTAGDLSPTELDARRARASREAVLAILDVCPYLQADEGWRSTSAQRDHRCRATRPPARLALDKQRRLCLRADHAECQTYLAAGAGRSSARASGPERADPERDRMPAGLWRFTRTAPAAIDDGRIGIPIAIGGRERTVPQAGLGAVLVGVLGILVVSRLAGGSDQAAIRDAAASPPGATTAVVVEPTPSSTPRAVDSATPEPEPSAVPSPRASPTGEVAGATATPPQVRTYRVRSGDTLYSIALRFDTTVKAIQAANEIDDPSTLRVGQLLQIP